MIKMILEWDMVSHNNQERWGSYLTPTYGLQQDGVGRGTIYFLPQAAIIDEVEEIFGFSRRSSVGLEESSGGLDESSGGSTEEEEESKRLSEIAELVRSRMNEFPDVGCKAVSLSDFGLVEDWLGWEFWKQK